MNTEHRLSFAALCGLAVVAGLAGGCGYALVGRASNLPPDVRAVYVEPLSNATSRSQVEQILTQAITDELVTRRRFSVVSKSEEADAVLLGSVVSFDVRPVSFDAGGLANDFEISITTDVKFRRQPAPGEDEGAVLWASSRYVFRQDYPLESEGLAYFDRETEAIEKVSTAFAKTLVTDLLEGF